MNTQWMPQILKICYSTDSMGTSELDHKSLQCLQCDVHSVAMNLCLHSISLSCPLHKVTWTDYSYQRNTLVSEKQCVFLRRPVHFISEDSPKGVFTIFYSQSHPILYYHSSEYRIKFPSPADVTISALHQSYTLFQAYMRRVLLLNSA